MDIILFVVLVHSSDCLRAGATVDELPPNQTNKQKTSGRSLIREEMTYHSCDVTPDKAGEGYRARRVPAELSVSWTRSVITGESGELSYAWSVSLDGDFSVMDSVEPHPASSTG